ncbi:MAG: NAD(P)/FAD-dependent oxidoreductase [Candidatus Krumholzibacteriaceae bacterium]|jgi:predicted Rossmann fold flavoprotein
MKYDVVVIGGGASGMFAAGRAAENGLRALLLERNSRLGKKLSITGNGRCNLTNTDETDEFVRNFGANGRFLYRALTELSRHDLVAFFKGHGVETREEDGGRIFPARGNSESVVRALERYLRRLGVAVRLNSRVEKITVDSVSGAVTGVKAGGREGIIEANNVILATGGLSYPRTGSTGDGYSMARTLGHTIVSPRPALVPLETREQFPKDLRGISLRDVRVTVVSDGKRVASENGSLLFTHFGVSGPVVLSLSALVVELLDEGRKVEISIDFTPALDGAAPAKWLVEALAGSGRRSIGTVMRALMPKALVPVLMRSSGIAADGKCSGITGDERKRLAALLADFRLRITRARSIDEAIVTRGGIDLKEINPRTMESRKVKGLYFCGEIMDIDGRTGGYNLQAAFSTAYLAAGSIRLPLRR